MSVPEMMDLTLYEMYEGVERINGVFYSFARGPIGRHRAKVGAIRLRNKIPDMMKSGYSVTCPTLGGYCDENTCEFKSRDNDVVEGCIKCGKFKIISENSSTLKA